MGELGRDVPPIPGRAPAGPGSSDAKDPDAGLAADRAVSSTRWGCECAGRLAQSRETRPYRSRPPVTRATRDRQTGSKRMPCKAVASVGSDGRNEVATVGSLPGQVR
jgi:hypothetical protein